MTDKILEERILEQSMPKPAPEFKHFRVDPCSPVIGGTLVGLDLADLNEESAEELRQALWHYGVLFAREQHLSPDQQKNVALQFGDELEKHTSGTTEVDDPEILRIEVIKSGKARLTTDMWHHDVTARTRPNSVEVLQAKVVAFGADTVWSSATAAFEHLPLALKLLFLNIDIEHDTLYAGLRHGNIGINKAITVENLHRLGETTVYPAVINHPVTGRLCLFVGNAYVKRVHGFGTELSESIIKLANEFPKIPEYQVRHQWREGDIAIWDNFSTSHYGVTGTLQDQPRLLYRVAAICAENARPSLNREKAIAELLDK